MSLLSASLALGLLLLFSALYSGSETGVYSLSRLRLEADASSGRRGARLLRALVRRDSTLLIALLVGNNLMLELATQLVQGRLNRLEGLPSGGRELVLTLFLTPIVFVFGELFPKDLFRRRPHQLLTALAPLLWLSRLLLFPLVYPLRLLTRALEGLFGLGDTELARALRRDEVLDIFTVGSREGTVPPQAAELARNVLVLRAKPVTEIMVPWARVVCVHANGHPEELLEAVRGARFTRLPIMQDGDGGSVVTGYLHQLEILSAAILPRSAGPLTEVEPLPLPAFEPELSLERALKSMRTSGQRIALVGSPEHPLGLVSLMDLLGTITEP